MGKKFVSSADESVRMFKSDFFEFFSHSHPLMPHLIYGPLVAFVLYKAPTTWSQSTLLVLGGLLVWTFAEYIIHRHLFHAPDVIMDETHEICAALRRDQAVLPELPTWRHTVYFLAHGVHHEYPSDSTRLVMPPGASLPIVLIFWLLFRFVAGAQFAPALFAGFIIGYLVYDSTHYAIHHLGMPTSWGRYLKKRHNQHHFTASDSDYGVSSPLWDVVFGTLNPERKAKL